MLLEVVVLALQILKYHATDRAIKLQCALPFFVQNPSRMDVPDAQSSLVHPVTKVNFLAVEEERFIKATHCAEILGLHHHASSDNGADLARGQMIPVRDIWSRRPSSPGKAKAECAVLQELVQQ